jgi:hypothetical protein
MKAGMVVALAAVLAPAAMAETFCDSLKTTLAAGAETPAPFDTLADPSKTLRANGDLASFAPSKPMAGLPDGARCERYLAYVDGKVVGGGEHNFITCRIAATSDGDVAALKAGQEALAGLADAAEACLAPHGWEKSPRTDVYNRGGRSQVQVFSKADEPMDVRFAGEGRGRGPVYWTFSVEVRTPAPKPPEQ